jgi:hypothetical protein
MLHRQWDLCAAIAMASLIRRSMECHCRTSLPWELYAQTPAATSHYHLLDYVIHRRKCGVERVSFSGEDSSSVPSSVKEIKFEKRGRAQEQSALCSAHVTAIGYRPALRYSISGEGSNSIPLPVKRIQAPQSRHIANDDDDEWEVIAEYATNHQQAKDAHDIVDNIHRHTEIFYV